MAHMTLRGRENRKFDRLSTDTQAELLLAVNQPAERETGRHLSLGQYMRATKTFTDLFQAGKTYRITGNTLQLGRFYTMEYAPLYRASLEVWDTSPVILCVEIGNRGFRGVNWHHVPHAARRRLLKNLILKHPSNKKNLVNNRAMDVFPFTRDLELNKRFNANRSYLYPGSYPNPRNPKQSMAAGAVSIQQIPYTNLPELFSLPSIYEAAWSYK